MSWTPSDDSDLVDRLADVLLRRRGYTLDARPGDDFLVQADGDQIDGARHDARAVLVAVGPMIAAAVWEEAYWRGVDDQITADDANMGYGPNRVNPYRIEKEAGR